MEVLVARTPAFGTAIGTRLQATFAVGSTDKAHRCFSSPSCQQLEKVSGPQPPTRLASSSFVGRPEKLLKFSTNAHSGDKHYRECRMEATPPLKIAAGESADCETAHPLLRRILLGMLTPYVKHNPSADRVMAILRKREGGGVLHFDHFAFRTFGVEGYGIDSMAKVFLDLGYKQRDELRFPAKKLRAYWYSPPKEAKEACGGDMTNGPLPRIFISELLVDQLSEKAQAIIRKYTSAYRHLAEHAALSSLVHGLPWREPEHKDYVELAKESEYAAWTLVNGYALNHTTITVHDFKTSSGLRNTVDHLIENGVALNGAGGTLINVSPDGRLLQASTEADVGSFTFAGGHVANVPRSYIEFAERLVLPEFEHLPKDEVHECHRREGFEVGNADNIFESTSIKR